MVEQERKRSFQETLQSGIGDGYAIPKGVYDELIFGSAAVVFLDKVDKRRKARWKGLWRMGKQGIT